MTTQSFSRSVRGFVGVLCLAGAASVAAAQPAKPASEAEKAVRARVEEYSEGPVATMNLQNVQPFYEPDFRNKYSPDVFARDFRRPNRFAPEFMSVENVAIDAQEGDRQGEAQDQARHPAGPGADQRRGGGLAEHGRRLVPAIRKRCSRTSDRGSVRTAGAPGGPGGRRRPSSSIPARRPAGHDDPYRLEEPPRARPASRSSAPCSSRSAWVRGSSSDPGGAAAPRSCS